jgi:uncharacterized protein (DUF1499 family)
MRRLLMGLAAVIALSAAALLGAGQAGWLAGAPPQDLGVREGRLAAPSSSPNSVNSQSRLWPGHPRRDSAHIEPLAVPAGEDPAAAFARLAAMVAAVPGARVVEQSAGYLRAEFTTRWLRFVDDAEFLLDAGAGVIHVRSASRLGESDLGTNRERVEALRRAFAAAASAASAPAPAPASPASPAHPASGR